MIILTEAVIEKRLREAIALYSVVTSARCHAPPLHRTTTAVSRDLEPTVSDVAEAISWLRWIENEDAALVEARLEGARWKMICFRFGISRPTAYRRWRHALGLIAWRLNGNVPPTGCSRRRFMKIAAEM